MPRGSRGGRGPRSSCWRRFSRSSLYSLSLYPGWRYFMRAQCLPFGCGLGGTAFYHARRPRRTTIESSFLLTIGARPLRMLRMSKQGTPVPRAPERAAALFAALLFAAILPAVAAGAAPPRASATSPAAPPASPAPVAETADAEGFERSIIRIVNFAQRGDWNTPWEVSGVRPSSGSGFVIKGGLILTNAHVVSDARLLLLYLHNDPTPHKASAVVLGHDCDLALVHPDEPGLLEGVPALELGGLPALRSTVETYGYPAGGDQISSTRGVVSRIEINVYTHSGVDQHITVQTDAAINPGNSG